jgi:hypothetical protein
MTTDPDQIRSTIATLLAALPESDAADVDLEAIAVRLEEAHEHLVGALEAVERGGSAPGVPPLAGASVATVEMGPTSEPT